ncbi:PAS domain S-box protein [Rhodothermus marinus]|uniref:PAS domain S-box protein n=1 Tax=Rhodothermus marinus TaxID=29549 RepID=UPI000AEAA8CA|nr:PAS domain S-box protein [Rhodothermus marinus]
MEVREAPGLKQEALYRALFETTQDAVLIADAETGQILEANPAAERLFGYDRATLCRMHQEELHPAELAASYRKKIPPGRRGRHLPGAWTDRAARRRKLDSRRTLGPGARSRWPEVDPGRFS